MSNKTTNSKLGNVLRVSSGNFLEMYDFMVYAYYASYIAHEIFPSSNAYASLMMTLGTFGAGYLPVRSSPAPRLLGVRFVRLSCRVS